MTQAVREAKHNLSRLVAAVQRMKGEHLYGL
jgi:hypothetical protein